MDEQIAAPVGFNITFAGMLSLGIGMDLEFPVQQTDLDGILHLREMELKRFVNGKMLAWKFMLYFFPVCISGQLV